MTKNENHIKKNHENAFFKHFLGCFYFMLNLWSYLQNVSSINIIYNHSIHLSGLKFNLKIPNILRPRCSFEFKPGSFATHFKLHLLFIDCEVA